MKHLYTILILFCTTLLTAQTELEEALFALPDVIFKKIDTPEGYEAAYEPRYALAVPTSR